MEGRTAERTVEYYAATAERWQEIEALFGPRGACAGCWDMWWRLTRAEFERNKGEGNKEAFKRIVLADEVPGLLALVDKVPAGWCAVQPREAYSALMRSQTLRPVDDAPVWAITCFFIARPYRRQGMTVGLLRAAVEHARANGAQIVEGYPVEPRGMLPDAFAWHGTAAAFRKAGFAEVARRSATRPIMRYTNS
jgi:GNAT superfamily N-acetyltransferase